MKGVIFTSFLDMVEEKFSYETVDTIINNSDLPSGGAYTAVGTYSHHEIVTLVVALSKHTQVPVPDLLHTYGKYLFSILGKAYGHWITAVPSALDLLEKIDNYIHVEVRKLYPDAELPRFETTRLSPHHVRMIYHSDRRMSALAVGLIEGAFEYYGEKCLIETQLLEADGSNVQFDIQKI